MSVHPPIPFLFISRRLFCLNLVLCCRFDRLQLFAGRASVISVSRVFGCCKCLALCSAVTNVWPCVRLLEVFGRVFGCFKSWACVGLLQVFGRVFGCYKCLAVCSAVSSSWPCVRLFQVLGRVFGCYKSLAVCSAVTIFGRVFGCYKRWPCVRPFQVSVSFGFVIFFMLLFVRFSTCFGLCHSSYLSRLLFPRWTLRLVHACFFPRSYIFSVVL